MTDNGLQLEIRPLRPEDIQRVVELAAALAHAPHWPAQVYEAMLHLKSPKRIALVAVDPIHNAVIGIAVAGLTPPEAELETIAVAAGWQRRGIARELFGAVADALRREQITEIHLEVRASNGKAVRFYRARGFGETGRRPRYYADPVEDAILMSLLLGDLGR